MLAQIEQQQNLNTSHVKVKLDVLGSFLKLVLI